MDFTWPILHFKVKFMHISSVNISQTMRDRTNITIVNTESRLWPFHWYIYILPWPILKVKVKVMLILTENISPMIYI